MNIELMCCVSVPADTHSTFANETAYCNFLLGMHNICFWKQCPIICVVLTNDSHTKIYRFENICELVENLMYKQS